VCGSFEGKPDVGLQELCVAFFRLRMPPCGKTQAPAEAPVSNTGLALLPSFLLSMRARSKPLPTSHRGRRRADVGCDRIEGEPPSLMRL